MKKKIILDNVEVTEESLPYVIAEIGHNHQGSVDQCKELFIKAKNSGANASKLQKRDNKKFAIDVNIAKYLEFFSTFL